MSWTWAIPVEIKPSLLLRSPLFDPDRLRVVVPTFRDWDGARMTVDSLLACRPLPAEIVLVNDNHEPAVPPWVRRYPIRLVEYAGNRGPAYARNAGARLTTGRPVDWFYFTDTGCFRDPSFFAILTDASMGMSRTTVGIAGPVQGVVASPAVTPINYYMTEEAILNPPRDTEGPQAIVTANAAVSAAAFRAVGGFDVTYPFAAGEDLDLGLRIRRVGTIGWAPHAAVLHRFEESVDDFRQRFVRYGAGNAHLQYMQMLPSMRVGVITARDVELQRLANIQMLAMQQGYDRHLNDLLEAAKRSRHRPPFPKEIVR